jgi:hypothetical protein
MVGGPITGVAPKLTARHRSARLPARGTVAVTAMVTAAKPSATAAIAHGPHLQPVPTAHRGLTALLAASLSRRHQPHLRRCQVSGESAVPC